MIFVATLGVVARTFASDFTKAFSGKRPVDLESLRRGLLQTAIQTKLLASSLTATKTTLTLFVIFVSALVSKL